MKRLQRAWSLLLVAAILGITTGALYQVVLADTADDFLIYLPAIVSGRISPPTNLVVGDLYFYPGQLALQWQDNSGNEEGFIIERRPTAGSESDFRPVGRTESNPVGYLDSGITPGVSYTYRVKAYRGRKESAYSNEASGTCTTQPPPAAPSNLLANPASSTSIILNWQDNSENEWNFEVFRSNTPTTGWNAIAKVSANNYTDTNLTPGQTYYYRVRARNNAFPTYSDFSNVASATTQQLTNPVLSGPAEATWSFNLTWTFQWTEPPQSEDHYVLEWSYSSTSDWRTLATYDNEDRRSPYFQEILPVAADIGKTTYYRVRALTNGNWRTSNVIGINVPRIVVTFYPTHDNLIYYMSIDPSYANQVYAHDYLRVGTNYVFGSYLAAFSALRFDGFVDGDLSYPLSIFISGRTIYSAILTLVPYTIPMPGITYSVHAFAQAWNPDTLTWNNCPNVYSDPYISVLPPANAGVPWNINVTTLVQKWADGAWSNYGLLLRDPSWGAIFGDPWFFQFDIHSMDTGPTYNHLPRLSLDIR